MTRDELETMVRVHQAEVYRYLRYLGAENPAVAEDLAQETFLAAFRSEPNRRDTETQRNTENRNGSLVIGHWERDGGTAGQASSGTDAERRRAAWLRGIARNLFLEHCRRVRTSPVKADSASLERAEATWAGEFLREDDGFDFKEALHKCMATLDDKYRRLLEMNYAQGKSRAEIAAAFEMSEDGVKSLLRRVRGSLAECIRKRLTAEGLGSRG